MRAAHLPDDQLTAADVPTDDAAVEDLLGFGHRYHAYKVAGSLQRVASTAVLLHDRFVDEHDADPGTVLKAPVAQLRIALFHTARAVDHGATIDDDCVTWMRVLVRSVGAAVDDNDHHRS